MNKIRLIDVDSKIPYLALMKLSAFHKRSGDDVGFYHPLFDTNCDTVYASKIFDFTPDYNYLPDGVIKGGFAYNNQKLLDDQEDVYPDYELYDCDYAIGFTSRGCPRKCPYCIVPDKEGAVKAVSDINGFWNGQKRLMLLDNNLTALPDHFELICNQLIENNIKTDFNQGLDIRLITLDMAQLLSKVRLWKQVHFAFDDIRYEKAVRRGIEILVKGGIAKHKLMFYVLIGFNSTPEEDMYRVELLRGLGIDPFVMPFNKNDRYQRRFARWANHKAIFKTVKWENYQ